MSSLLTRRIARISLWVAAALMLLCILVAALVATQSGSRWVLSYVFDRINGGDLVITAEDIGGNLVSGLTAASVSIKSPAIEAEIKQFTSSWQLMSWLRGEARIEQLRMAQLDIDLPATESVSESGETNGQLPELWIEWLEIGQINSSQLNGRTLRDVSTTLKLAESEVVLTGLSLAADEGTIVGDVNVQVQRMPTIDASIDWQMSSALIEGLPPLAGGLVLRGDLSTLVIENTLTTPYSITSMGELTDLQDLTRLQLDLEHSARQLNLNPFVEGATVADVTLSTTGTLDELEISLQGSARLNDFPTHAIAVSGLLEPQRFTATSFQLGQGQSQIRGVMNLEWSETFRGAGTYDADIDDVEVYLTGVNTAGIEPQTVRSQGNFAFAWQQEQLEITAEIGEFTSLINGNEIAGRGALRWQPDSLSINGLVLENESTRLSLEGSLGDSNNLAWQIRVADLGQLVEQAAGRIEGAGSVSGSLTAPFLMGTLSMAEMQYGAIELASLEATIEGSPENFQAGVDLSQLSYTSDSVEEILAEVSVELEGSADSLMLSFSSVAEAGTIDLALEGGGLQQNPLSWQGNLSRLELTASKTWQLQSPIGLQLSQQAAEIEEFCLVSDVMQICGALNMDQQSGHGNFTFALNELPLAEISTLNRMLPIATLAGLTMPELPTGLSLAGTASASIDGGLTDGQLTELNFDLQSADAATIITQKVELDESDLNSGNAETVRSYQWQGLSFTGQLNEQRWDLGASGELLHQQVVGEQLPLEGEFDLSLTLNADRSLTGSSSINFDDLAWVEVYTPDISSITGSLSSELTIGGPLAAPQVNGYVAMEDSGFSLDTWGVVIEDFSGRIDASGEGSAIIRARADSEGGQIVMSGSGLDLFGDTPEIFLNLTGENFPLLDSADLSVLVSPQLQLHGSSDRIHLAGSVLLPHLNITMAALPDAAIDVSSDVVIVSYPEDRPDLARSVSAQQSQLLDIPLTAAIDLQLGEDVRFSGLGLDLELGGSLAIEQLRNGSNRTFGELSIEQGTYTLYGQTLQLEAGELLFIGPYDNPGLDIRASRSVDGTTVGVQMNGTLRNIQSELFSTPALPEIDIVALLTTGRPFSELGQSDEDALLGSVARLGLSRGRAMSERMRVGLGLDTLAISNTGDINNSLLTVGKYLTPSLFVRYGLGLFDSQSKIAVDYQLSETLKLQAESGEAQSLDITYSIER